MTSRVAFLVAVDGIEGAPGGLTDRSVARWVASGLEGIARGFEDAGDAEGANVLRFAGAEMIRELASGKWRSDVVEAAMKAPVGATDPDTEVIERQVSADGEVSA
ncbi:MAG: hypothetical protein KF878_00255 [Planctomycetes bacterium]|nr:hypothetical protein [Planctomycetota bacterium]